MIDGADTTLDLMERVPVTEKMRPLTEIRLEKVSNPLLSFVVFYSVIDGSALLRRWSFIRIRLLSGLKVDRWVEWKEEEGVCIRNMQPRFVHLIRADFSWRTHDSDEPKQRKE